MSVFFLLSGVGALAHEPSACDQVRAVRQMAQAAALDTATLDTLARRMCEGAVKPAASDDCATLETLYWISFAGDLVDNFLEELWRARQQSCQAGRPALARWSNGMAAVSADGRIQYPNAITARNIDGSWQYPSAITARHPDGSWQYPSAITARRADGTWQDPSGNTIGGEEALSAWACQKAPDACEQMLEAVRHLDGDPEIAALISLAWLASQRD